MSAVELPSEYARLLAARELQSCAQRWRDMAARTWNDPAVDGAVIAAMLKSGRELEAVAGWLAVY